MFMFDVETLDTESTTVVLSAALVYFEAGQDYQTILDNTCFVKFDAKEQITDLGRTTSKSTLNWWKEQSDYAQKVSLKPSDDDVPARLGVEILTRYMDKYDPERKAIVWARGSLDQMAIDSLATAIGGEVIAPYYVWRDVRTAVDCLTGSTNGYCDVNHETFNRDLVIKHHPAHDCALDAMMLMYGR